MSRAAPGTVVSIQRQAQAGVPVDVKDVIQDHEEEDDDGAVRSCTWQTGHQNHNGRN
jgi:hypothetical protein